MAISKGAAGVLVQLNLFINRESRTLCTRSGRRMLGYRGCAGGGGLRMADYTRETSILICCFIVGSIEGKEIFIKMIMAIFS